MIVRLGTHHITTRVLDTLSQYELVHRTGTHTKVSRNKPDRIDTYITAKVSAIKAPLVGEIKDL